MVTLELSIASRHGRLSLSCVLGTCDGREQTPMTLQMIFQNKKGFFSLFGSETGDVIGR